MAKVYKVLQDPMLKYSCVIIISHSILLVLQQPNEEQQQRSYPYHRGRGRAVSSGIPRMFMTEVESSRPGAKEIKPGVFAAPTISQ